MSLRLLAAATTVAAMLGAAAAQAQDDTIDYEVQRGESLYLIAQRLFEDARQWPLVARLNRLAQPAKLQPGQRLQLPLALLKGEPMTARVEYVRGPVRADGAALRIGDALGEGASLEVGAQGFVSLRLHDGSLLQLQSNSRSKLLRLRELAQARRGSALIQLDQGRVDATAAPQSPGSRFEVKTPLATTGVRGTRFGVAVAVQGPVTADVVEGRVEVQAGRGQPAAVAAGHGAVVQRGAAPLVKPLLPPPGLPQVDERIERMPGTLPLRAAASAARVRVELSDDDSFARVLATVEGPLPLAVDGLPDGRYRVRARAIDGNGLLGEEALGSVWIKTEPVAPLARSPLDGQISAPREVEIVCTEVPQARGYLLQVATSDRFDPLLLERRSEGGRCRFALDELPEGEIRWRVASLAPDAGRLERGPFSDVGRFRVVPLPQPPQGEQIAIDGNSVQWTPAPGLRYRVQIAADTGFAQLLQDQEVSGGRLELAVAPRCAPYALRLQAIDEHGRRSPFSPPRLVHTDADVCTGDGTPLRFGDGQAVRLSR